MQRGLTIWVTGLSGAGKTTLSEALAGEVDPKTLTVDVEGEGEKMSIVVSFTLAAINHTERQAFLIGEAHG